MGRLLGGGLALLLVAACGDDRAATPVDAGSPDAGAVEDGGPPDAGREDAGGTVDAGVADAGDSDAGLVDAGTVDAGLPDAGLPDAGTVDAGLPDAGTADAGLEDAGTVDAGTPDAGTMEEVEVFISSDVENRDMPITVGGSVVMAGVTEPKGPVPGLVVEAGYGPRGSDARGDGWVWRSAPFSEVYEKYIGYDGWLRLPEGQWDIAMRFTLGATVLYADTEPDTEYLPAENAQVTVRPPGTEIPYCSVWHPKTASTAPWTRVLIYGRVYVPGLTDSSQHPAYQLTSEVGFGPNGSDPRSSDGWLWFPGFTNPDYCCFAGNDDEHYGPLWPRYPGTYHYAFRFRRTDGATGWTYCDTDGSGTNPGLDFDPAKLGVLTSP